jgi:hypothetical protein
MPNEEEENEVKSAALCAQRRAGNRIFVILKKDH